MSSQTYTVDYDRSHQKQERKVVKKGSRLHPVWEQGRRDEGREGEPSKKVSKKSTVFWFGVRMGMFSKEDKDWEMRMVLMD